MSTSTIEGILRAHIARTCEQKIAAKGEGEGVSFYAFFANKNDDPHALMSVATWRISTHQLNHFEKATKIAAIVKAGV